MIDLLSEPFPGGADLARVMSPDTMEAEERTKDRLVSIGRHKVCTQTEVVVSKYRYIDSIKFDKLELDPIRVRKISEELCAPMSRTVKSGSPRSSFF